MIKPILTSIALLAPSISFAVETEQEKLTRQFEEAKAIYNTCLDDFMTAKGYYIENPERFRKPLLRHAQDAMHRVAQSYHTASPRDPVGEAYAAAALVYAEGRDSWWEWKRQEAFYQSRALEQCIPLYIEYLYPRR